MQRIMHWIHEQWDRLLAQGANGSGWSPVVTALVAAAVLALLAFVLPRVRRERRRAGGDDAVLTDPSVTAAMYRARAAEALARGRFDDALADAYRAIARGATERTLLDDGPGRTAHEVALALGPVFPDHRDRLRQAADLFDAVRYGSRHISRSDAEQVADLDRHLARTRPALTVAPGAAVVAP